MDTAPMSHGVPVYSLAVPNYNAWWQRQMCANDVPGGGGFAFDSAEAGSDSPWPPDPGNYRPSHKGVFTFTLKLSDTQHSPPLEVLLVLTRTLIGSMLFSATGGYCSSLNNYSRVC